MKIFLEISSFFKGLKVSFLFKFVKELPEPKLTFPKNNSTSLALLFVEGSAPANGFFLRRIVVEFHFYGSFPALLLLEVAFSLLPGI